MSRDEARDLLERCLKVLFYRDCRALNKVRRKGKRGRGREGRRGRIREGEERRERERERERERDTESHTHSFISV